MATTRIVDRHLDRDLGLQIRRGQGIVHDLDVGMVLHELLLGRDVVIPERAARHVRAHVTDLDDLARSGSFFLSPGKGQGSYEQYDRCKDHEFLHAYLLDSFPSPQRGTCRVAVADKIIITSA